MLNLFYNKFKKCLKKIRLRSDFGNRTHLVKLLPSELKDKVKYNVKYDQIVTDEILGIDEIWLNGHRKLIVKQELYIEDLETDYHLFKDEHIDGKL